ncbi:MAG: hypothetical protein JW797_01930 [Bradymonadales bacterium]|nr:hypothetical protein [Bradymonadales bacterium]
MSALRFLTGLILLATSLASCGFRAATPSSREPFQTEERPMADQEDLLLVAEYSAQIEELEQELSLVCPQVASTEPEDRTAAQTTLPEPLPLPADLEEEPETSPSEEPEPPEPEEQAVCGADVCHLRDRICDLSLRICVISGRHPEDDGLDLQCEDASGRCRRADRQVVERCGCVEWEPVHPG